MYIFQQTLVNTRLWCEVSWFVPLPNRIALLETLSSEISSPAPDLLDLGGCHGDNHNLGVFMVIIIIWGLSW